MLVVLVVDALPDDVFPRILLLLQRENVPDEELLQLLIGEVDAQLLEAGGERFFLVKLTKAVKSGRMSHTGSTANLFLVKFSKPKMSSKPMDCWASSVSSCSL